MDRLKRLATFHNRSLQGEFHAMIRKAIEMSPEPFPEPELRLTKVKTNTTSAWGREDIYNNDGR